METIARLAGHSNIATTGVYLHIATENLTNAVEVLANITEESTMAKGGIAP
jgi:site-specific recombinase XerD